MVFFMIYFPEFSLVSRILSDCKNNVLINHSDCKNNVLINHSDMGFSNLFCALIV